MLKDGEYVAWFRTPRGSGTGTVSMKDGKISGRDSVISYDGTYTTEGDIFTAVVLTRRHTPGQESLVGEDEVTLRLTGVSKGDVVACSGSQIGIDPMTVDITLMPVKPNEAKPASVYSPSDFHPERLPKSKAR